MAASMDPLSPLLSPETPPLKTSASAPPPAPSNEGPSASAGLGLGLELGSDQNVKSISDHMAQVLKSNGRSRSSGSGSDTSSSEPFSAPSLHSPNIKIIFHDQGQTAGPGTSQGDLRPPLTPHTRSVLSAWCLSSNILRTNPPKVGLKTMWSPKLH